MRTLTGEKLVDIVAVSVRRFVERYDPPKIYLFISGGKDSAAAAAAVAYAGDSALHRTIVVYNEVAGNTHPLNIEQAYKVLARLGFEEPVKIVSPPYVAVKTAIMRGLGSIHIVGRNRHGGDFWDGVVRWGIPVLVGRGTRWCYAEHKQRHWDALPAFNGRRYVVVGVKAADSHWRRARWRLARDNTREFHVRRLGIVDVALSPILRLTNNHIWQLLRETGLDKELQTYSMCGDSLNCVFCPFRSREKQRIVVECVAKDTAGKDILLNALNALNRTKPGTITHAKAREWREMIEAALTQGHEDKKEERKRGEAHG